MTDLTKNIAEAERALVEKPLFATSAERVAILDELKSTHKEDPQPKRFAYFLSTLLSRVSVPLEDYDLIAGRCVDRELTPEEERARISRVTLSDVVRVAGRFQPDTVFFLNGTSDGVSEDEEDYDD